MPTGSAASDGDDFETLCPGRRRRTGRKFGFYDPTRFTDEELEEEEEEEEEDAGGMKQQERKVSKSAHKDARQSQRNAANARERARMRVLSKAFSRLKTTLPWVPADTKLSKLDTLRLASSYITHLRQLLQDDRFESSFAHPVSLTWPFMMTGRSEDTQDMSPSVRLCGATA